MIVSRFRIKQCPQIHAFPIYGTDLFCPSHPPFEWLKIIFNHSEGGWEGQNKSVPYIVNKYQGNGLVAILWMACGM